jgi:hypothetical protein
MEQSHESIRAMSLHGLCLRLLMLYPSDFRREYAEQIQQLVRDRLRYDTPGKPPGIRFWLSLLIDLVRTALLERLESLMTPSTISRVGGPLAVVGGLFWAGFWSVEGTGTDTENGFWILMLISIASIAGCLLTIAVDSTLPGDRLRLTSAMFGILGIVLGLVGVATGIWWLHAGGLMSVVTATILVGISMLLASWMPRLIGWSLIVTSILVVFSNTENWQIWLSLPFGAAWIVLGYALWSRASIRMTLAP